MPSQVAAEPRAAIFGGGCANDGWAEWENRVVNANDDAAFRHIDNRFAYFYRLDSCGFTTTRKMVLLQ